MINTGKNFDAVAVFRAIDRRLNRFPRLYRDGMSRCNEALLSPPGLCSSRRKKALIMPLDQRRLTPGPTILGYAHGSRHRL